MQKTIYVRNLPFWEKVEKEAKQIGVSVSNLIEIALLDYIAKEERNRGEMTITTRDLMQAYYGAWEP